MKRLVFVMVVAALAFYFYGDPAGLLGRVSTWACEWLHAGKTC